MIHWSKGCFQGFTLRDFVKEVGREVEKSKNCFRWFHRFGILACYGSVIFTQADSGYGFFLFFFLPKHSNGCTELESEGNLIALQITHYLKRACYRIDVRYKGRRYLPVLAFFRWIKIAKN